MVNTKKECDISHSFFVSGNLQTYAVQGRAEHLCTVLYCLQFVGKQGRIHLAKDTLGTENAGERKTYVLLDAVTVVRKAGNGENGVVGGEDRLGDGGDTGGNGVIGRALSLDDLTAGVSYVFFNAAQEYLGLLLGVVVNVAAILLEVHTDDAGNAPGEGGGIAVLTEYVGVNVLRADGETVGNQTAKSGGVQHSAASDDLACGKTGILDEGVSENINGVADNDVYCVGAVACDLGSDLRHQLGVDTGKLQTGLTGLSADTGGDDDDIGACRIGIIACINVQGRGEGRTVDDIHCLALCFRAVDINENDLGSETVLCQGVRYGSAYVADTENGNLFAHKTFLFSMVIFYNTILAKFSEKARDSVGFPNMDYKCGHYIFVMTYLLASTKKRTG